ncbi:hypothetical protein [Salinibacterium sp. GXW1014]|uniref:hypothetical protein n=1 Tax=Salinibacterium sp. GXW1014 TaxID=3377838 RepID=UPI00383BD9A0
MEAAELWISFLATASAIAAAAFAFVQAKTATDARRDAVAAESSAVAARDAAVQAQKASATNSGRIAEVMEAQAAAHLAAAKVRPDPWQLRSGGSRRTGTAVVLVHGGEGAVADVSIEVERQPYLVHFEPNPVPARFEPGDSVHVYYARSAADPATSTLVVHWRWDDADEMQISRSPLT